MKGRKHNMRRTALTLIFGSLLTVSLTAADQQLVNMIMPEAKVVAGINVFSARNSPFGLFILKQTTGSAVELQKFVEATGFNPQTDLDEILIATPGMPVKPADAAAPAAQPGTAAPTVPPALAAGGPLTNPDMHGLILARGHFNVEKLSKFAQTDGKQNVQKYREATLISDPKNPIASSMAFIGDTVVVAGDLASVKAALDRRSLANTLEPQLASKVASLSTSQDAWAISMVPFASMGGGPSADPTIQGAFNGDLFKKITSTSGGIKFGPEIMLSTEMVAADEKNASALGDVVRFLAGMASMNAGSAKGAPSGVVALLQGLTVKSEGNVVNLTVSVPEEQLESLFKAIPGQMRHPGATI
jgi:hypothetical protein